MLTIPQLAISSTSEENLWDYANNLFLFIVLPSNFRIPQLFAWAFINVVLIIIFGSPNPSTFIEKWNVLRRISKQERHSHQDSSPPVWVSES